VSVYSNVQFKISCYYLRQIRLLPFIDAWTTIFHTTTLITLVICVYRLLNIEFTIKQVLLNLKMCPESRVRLFTQVYQMLSLMLKEVLIKFDTLAFFIFICL